MMLLAMLMLVQDADLRARLDRQPKPVIAFVERRADCNHWGGEEPYDAERRREIEANSRDLRCERIDRDERMLRKRYRKSPEVLAILEETADLPGID